MVKPIEYDWEKYNIHTNIVLRFDVVFNVIFEFFYWK